MIMRAEGVRRSYAEIPAFVRDWVVATLGEPVIATEEQSGGMSPGCATRLITESGRRAFVKAVGADLNPDTPTLFRRELAVLTVIGKHPLWAPLRGHLDRDGWVALLLDDVAGRHPDPSTYADRKVIETATDRLVDELAARTPADPSDLREHGRVVEFSRLMERWAAAFGHLADTEAAGAIELPEAIRADPAAWEKRVRCLGRGQPRQLCHWDIRSDNLLLKPTGTLVFVDWGMACLGPSWADPLLARLEWVAQPTFDDSCAQSQHLASRHADITALLAGLGTFLAWRAATAVDVNLPTLNAFRTRVAQHCFAGFNRRLG